MEVFSATEIIYVVKNSFLTSVSPPKVPAPEETEDVGSHDHRRVSSVSQDREVTTPLSTSTFESELNDVVGLWAPRISMNSIRPPDSFASIVCSSARSIIR